MRIALDIGNVLVRFHIDRFLAKFNELVLDGEFHTEVDPMDFLLDLHGSQDCGLTTVDRKARERFGWDKSRDYDITSALMEAWDSTIALNDTMTDFLNDLKKDKVSVALLSNMGYSHARLFRNKYPDFFKGCILHLSCEVGARKPTKLFYQSFLLENPDFKGCLYLDDRLENVEAGKRFGFDARLFDLEEFLKLEQSKQVEKLNLIKKQTKK